MKTTMPLLKKISPAVRTQGPTKRFKNASLAEPHPDADVLSIKRILVPVDFSEESRKALAYAITFAYKFGARLTLLYVIEHVATPDFSDSFPLMLDTDAYVKQCRQRLKKLAKTMAIEPFIEELIVREGKSFHKITETAEELGVDLIIISTHGYTGLKHAILGSTTERVVQHAHCPVLVTRLKERDFLPTSEEV